jgi:hypothetical protein
VQPLVRVHYVRSPLAKAPLPLASAQMSRMAPHVSFSVPLRTMGLNLARMHFSVAAIAALTLANAGVAHAQGSSKALSSAAGVVEDSIRGRPLVGAIVIVNGTNRKGTTDAKGSYTIDSIPPGEYTLQVRDSVLDTMGEQLVTKPIAFTAGHIIVTDLAIPTLATLTAALCPASALSDGPGMLLGRVTRAETDSVAAGATVTVLWEQYALSERSVKRVPRVRRATVGKDGYYQVCGLPASVNGSVQATIGKSVSGEVAFAISDTAGSLGLRSITIGTSEEVPEGVKVASDSGTSVGAKPRLGPGVLMGRVVTKNGLGVREASVGVIGAASTTTTNENGDFTLAHLPTGTQTVRVRKLGFSSVEKVVELVARTPTRVTVDLGEYVPQMRAVSVETKSDSTLRQVGFTRREKTGMGTYLTAEDLLKKPGNTFLEIFSTIPGVRTMIDRNGDPYLVSTRDPRLGCVNYYLDGVYQQNIDNSAINHRMLRTEIGAMEIYQPSFTPIEYTPPERSGCMAILVWTKTKLGYKDKDRDRDRR